MDIRSIVETALAEHDEVQRTAEQINKFIDEVNVALAKMSTIPAYSPSSAPLSTVSFHCLLQDTSYPLEVYMPPSSQSSSSASTSTSTATHSLNLDQLQERWVGWGVEIPGEQPWSTSYHSTGSSNGHGAATTPLPREVHGKFPLSGWEGDYTGALIKIYDDTISPRPASTLRVVGLASNGSLPSQLQEEEDVVVPVIHVLRILPETETTQSDTLDIGSLSLSAGAGAGATRDDLVNHLANAFSPPDQLAGEILLLSLISAPTIRPPSLPPLGSLSINLIRRDASSSQNLLSTLSSLTPRIVELPLSLPLLHSQSFAPKATDAGLEAGLLQLAEGTVLLVSEDEMGSGGELKEKAVKNLQVLMDCIRDQVLKYEYPFMDSLKMECAIRPIVLSAGKSLIPVDINLHLFSDPSPVSPSGSALETYRQYLATHSSVAHAAKLVIPDLVAKLIQDDFVARRKDEGADAEIGLKRRMRLARLVALSTKDAELNTEVWDKTIDLDRRIEARSRQ